MTTFRLPRLVNLNNVDPEDWMKETNHLYIGTGFVHDGNTYPCSVWANTRNLSQDDYRWRIIRNRYLSEKIKEGYFDKINEIGCWCDPMIPCHGHSLLDAIYTLKKRPNILPRENEMFPYCCALSCLWGLPLNIASKKSWLEKVLTRKS